MAHDDHDIVRIYSGPLVTVELYQQALRDAQIEGKVVGLDLTAGIGSAIADSVELWVRGEDADRARAAIERYEETRGRED